MADADQSSYNADFNRDGKPYTVQPAQNQSRNAGSSASNSNRGRGFNKRGGYNSSSSKDSDLLDVVTFEKPTLSTPLIASDSSAQLSLFYGLICIFRKTLTRTTNELYGGEIAKRMHIYFQDSKFGMVPDDVTALSGYINNEKLTMDYRKVIAAIDMFFQYFADAEYAGMRMATLPSRYRGCAALTSLGQIAHITGIDVVGLSSFVFTTQVAKEYARVCKEDEGGEDPDGYFPC